jgi:hypothetical protein
VYIALKDINNYCYDSDEVVPVEIRIDGPYEHPDSEAYLAETRTKVIDFKANAERKIVPGKVSTDECSQYYEYTFTHQARVFETTGWYSLQVFVNGKSEPSVQMR